MDSLVRKTGRPSLETFAGVRSALAKVLRKVGRGKLSNDTGRTLILGYRTMNEILRDERDNKYKKRVRVLWEAHQRGGGAALEDDEANTGVQ